MASWTIFTVTMSNNYNTLKSQRVIISFMLSLRCFSYWRNTKIIPNTTILCTQQVTSNYIRYKHILGSATTRCTLNLSDFAWCIHLVNKYILKEHMETLLILRQWVTCHSEKKTKIQIQSITKLKEIFHLKNIYIK